MIGMPTPPIDPVSGEMLVLSVVLGLRVEKYALRSRAPPPASIALAVTRYCWASIREPPAVQRVLDPSSVPATLRPLESTMATVVSVPPLATTLTGASGRTPVELETGSKLMVVVEAARAAAAWTPGVGAVA